MLTPQEKDPRIVALEQKIKQIAATYKVVVPAKLAQFKTQKQIAPTQPVLNPVQKEMKDILGQIFVLFKKVQNEGKFVE